MLWQPVAALEHKIKADLEFLFRKRFMRCSWLYFIFCSCVRRQTVPSFSSSEHKMRGCGSRSHALETLLVCLKCKKHQYQSNTRRGEVIYSLLGEIRLWSWTSYQLAKLVSHWLIGTCISQAAGRHFGKAPQQQQTDHEQWWGCCCLLFRIRDGMMPDEGWCDRAEI